VARHHRVSISFTPKNLPYLSAHRLLYQFSDSTFRERPPRLPLPSRTGTSPSLNLAPFEVQPEPQDFKIWRECCIGVPGVELPLGGWDRVGFDPRFVPLDGDSRFVPSSHPLSSHSRPLNLHVFIRRIPVLPQISRYLDGKLISSLSFSLSALTHVFSHLTGSRRNGFLLLRVSEVDGRYSLSPTARFRRDRQLPRSSSRLSSRTHPGRPSSKFPFFSSSAVRTIKLILSQSLHISDPLLSPFNGIWYRFSRRARRFFETRNGERSSHRGSPWSPALSL